MAQSAQVVDVGGRRLRLSNLDKVLYPATGTTKAEVIDYYSRIAPVMLPHLAGRPVTRLRWPEGTGEPPFFAKDLEAGAPEWMPRHAIDHSRGAKDYPLVTDVAGLVYLAQVASLELHTPQWRFDHGGRGCPDRLVLDLDPGPGVGLAECAEVARRARGILSDMGMEPLPVTSGSKGIHLYAALDATRSSDEISAVARELARALEADDPALVVSAMSKAARPGKVFVDWSQNNAAKTTIAPYSMRGRAQPTVAAPRTWAELDDPDLRHLLLDEVLARAAADGDLLAALAPDPLAPYMAKRTPAATPEPFPSSRHVSAEPPRSGAPNHGGSAESWRFRDSGAPRVAAALGPQARARRGARQLGGAARHPRFSRPQPSGGDDRAAPDRVPHVRRRDPRRRVRRRHHDRLGLRHVHGGEVARRRGHRDAQRPHRRPPRAGPSRPDPHVGYR